MRHVSHALLLAGLLSGCNAAGPSVLGAEGKGGVVVANETGAATVVHIAFGADSVVLPARIPFCVASGPLNCSFPLAAHEERALPIAGKYLNATLTFGAPVGCGTTKAELNVNNPGWYDILDVSLVDGFSHPVKIQASGSVTIEAKSKEGNEKALGVYPLGCDICVARQKPSCGMSPGKDGCKSGTQYNPVVPCQWQGTVMGGGTKVRVALVLPGVPA
jgi:hypothetical protein